MNTFSLHKLLQLAHQKQTGEDTFFTEIFFDSRNIISGEKGIFFCLETDKEKALQNIAQAKDRKIFGVVSSFEIKDKDLISIQTENPLRLLQKYAQYHLSRFPNLQTLGITGSNGKTILKEWLFSSLNDTFSIIRSPKSYNSQIGLPLSVLETKENHQIGIFECGISKKGEMKHLEQILKPKIGILTRIGSAHLENFSSEKELIEEKIELFKDSDTIIYNSDNELVDKIIQATYPNKKLVSFGRSSSAHVQLLSQKNNSISLIINDIEENYTVKFDDQASIDNQLALIATLKLFNFSKEEIQERLLKLEPIEMRLELKTGIYNSVILNDTFNADLPSIKIALEKLHHQNKEKKSVFITEVYQSEKEEKILYEMIFNLLNKYQLNKVIGIGGLMKKYKHLSTNPIEVYSDTEELIKNFHKKEIENSCVLIKGSRKFQLEKFVKTIENQSHDTILEVNLTAILENIKRMKEHLNPSTKIMAMVKANSYGTGSYEIAEMLQHHKIDYLGVAYADEGVVLRENGIYLPIMVMNPEQNSYNTLIDYQLEPEIYSIRVLKLFLTKLQEKTISQSYPIHIKLDTGMHRLGFQPDQIEELINELQKNPNVYVKSVFTHLASTDENDQSFTKEQVTLFDRLYSTLRTALGYAPMRHVLNSHGIIYFPEYQMDMVRIGISMYGYSSDEKIQHRLKNVVTLKTKISQIISIQKGESVGYNRRFIADKPSKIATLPVGYADGISRKLGNGNFQVLVHGSKASTVGTICMDMMMVDVTDISCKEGDEVIVYGEKNTLSEAAKKSETITYEMLTSLSGRVKRIYIGES